MYQFPYTMYHSKNNSFISSFRFEESSLAVEVQVWECNISTVKIPTDIIDLCLSVQEVYFLRERWQVQRLACRGGMPEPTRPFFDENPKILDYFLFFF